MLAPQIKYIEKIVANFDDEQCIDLYNCTPFAVAEDTIKKLCSICPNKDKCKSSVTPTPTSVPESESESASASASASEPTPVPLCKNEAGQYVIKDELLYLLRGNIINYLNTLECVLLTWELGIVEQDVIVQQFAFLDKKRQKERALETFRTIAGGGHSYPAIETFYQFLNREAAKKAEEVLKDIID